MESGTSGPPQPRLTKLLSTKMAGSPGALRALPLLLFLSEACMGNVAEGKVPSGARLMGEGQSGARAEPGGVTHGVHSLKKSQNSGKCGRRSAAEASLGYMSSVEAGLGNLLRPCPTKKRSRGRSQGEPPLTKAGLEEAGEGPPQHMPAPAP